MGFLTENDEVNSHNVILRPFEGPPYPDNSVSRILLSEEEKAKEDAQNFKNKYLLECHVPPIVWTRTQRGYRVQGLTSRHHYDVVNLIRDYMPTDPLLRIVEDQQGIDDYLEAVFSWVSNTQSLVAIKEGSKEVVGVLVGRLVERESSERLLRRKYASEKDRFAHLKTCGGPNSNDSDRKNVDKSATGKQDKRASKAPRRLSKRKEEDGGGSRKSMGAKRGERKSLRTGSRKSMAGGRKSLGAKRGSRKSMASGLRKSMSSKGGGRKSLKTGSRKSMGGRRKSMGAKRILKRRASSGKEEWKVFRPIDVVPEEDEPISSANVFDDDEIAYRNKTLQLMHSFRKKLAGKFNVWKIVSQKFYYRIYLVAVSPRYRQMEVESTLFESLKHVCLAFNVHSVAGILTKYDSQNAFYRSGGLMVYEVLYENYPIFNDHEQRRSAAVMYLDL